MLKYIYSGIIILWGVIEMGLWNTEKCPICGKETNALGKSAIKKDNSYICRNCFLKLKKE